MIHDKYREYVNQAKAGYVRGITYVEFLEIVQWISRTIGRDIASDWNCPNCVINTLKNFAQLEPKTVINTTIKEERIENVKSRKKAKGNKNS
jgi:hypothetical protein